MAEELAEILQNFDLSSAELQTTTLGHEEIGGGVQECRSSLIGKVVGEKVSNYTGIKNFVIAAWSFPRELQVVELGPNLFQFILPSANDRLRILSGGPWIVDNQVLVLSEWYEGIEEDAEAFRSVPLWVQVWNLPVHWMSKEAGRRLGSNFQSVREVIVPQTGGKEGRHLKLFVVADISQPLLRGTIVKVGEQTKWASFKYERCPDFCYKCGIIGHSERNCQRQDDKGLGKKDNQYGPWLRAGNVRSPQHKQQVGTVYNPQKHHWRLQDGEWREKRQSEGLEKALESQLDNESGLARKLVADTGLVTSSGRGQDGQGSGSIGDVRVHSEKLNESGSKVGSELTEILHIGQSKGVISNPNCRAQMQGYLNQKNSSQSNQPLKVQ